MLRDLETILRHEQAKAEVVAHAIELVAPSLEGAGAPLRRHLHASDEGGPLEKLFGSPQAKAHVEAWRELEALRVGGAFEHLDDHGAATKGGVFGDELFLLSTGALVRVVTTGTWHRIDDGAQRHVTAVVKADEVEPADALRAFPWVDVLLAMHLHLQRTSPGERLERFLALVSRAAEALLPSTEGLDAVVRKG